MHVTTSGAVPLQKGGMSQAIRSHDWRNTSLGPLHQWPASLRIAVDMLLASKFPGCLVWGADMVSIPNDAFLPLLGNKPPALGRGFDDVWSDVWADIGSLVFRVMNGEAIFIENLPLVTDRNGASEQVYFTFCYSPVRDENGDVVGFLDTVFETTASVAAQQQWRSLAISYEKQALASTESRNLCWEFSSDVVLMIQPDLHILGFNPSCRKTLGWQDQAMGRSILSMLHPNDVDAVLELLGKLQDGQMVQGIESRLRHVEGHYRWFSWAALPGKAFTTVVGRDITLEREREAALRQAEELLRHSQKMEAVGQLTGGIAHDFNNLLSGISGSLELLERRLAQGRIEQAGKYIEAAKDAAQRAATLTHRLLAFASRQPLNPRPTDLNALIRGMQPLIKQMLGPQINLRLQLDPWPWPVLVDASQLENAVLNLCINARDALSDAGEVRISTGNERFAPGLHGHDGLHPGDYSCIKVEDSGCGMTAQVMSQAFDPFFTTKPQGQGTGLGLSMVYGFACQSGGRAWIESVPAQGTSVQLLLPRHDGVVPQPAPVCSPQAPARAQGEHILLVDDEPTLRMLVQECLEEAGYHVSCAEDASSALATLQRLGHVDLLLTDIGLPGGISGRQLASSARVLQPGLKVLFITGYTDVAQLLGTSLEPGTELLSKPFSLDVLIDTTAALLQPERSEVCAAVVCPR